MAHVGRMAHVIHNNVLDMERSRCQKQSQQLHRERNVRCDPLSMLVRPARTTNKRIRRQTPPRPCSRPPHTWKQCWTRTYPSHHTRLWINQHAGHHKLSTNRLLSRLQNKRSLHYASKHSQAICGCTFPSSARFTSDSIHQTTDVPLNSNHCHRLQTYLAVTTMGGGGGRIHLFLFQLRVIVHVPPATHPLQLIHASRTDKP